jgi:osmotically-inducible protein OsmY
VDTEKGVVTISGKVRTKEELEKVVAIIKIQRVLRNL